MAEDKLENGPESRLAPADQPDGPETELPIPREFLENIPPEQRSRITRLFSSINQFVAPVFNPVLQRITAEHITQLINNAEAQSQRQSESEKSGRRYQFAYFAITLVALLSLLVFFTLQERFDVLTAVITGIAGLGAGFGLGRATGRR